MRVCFDLDETLCSLDKDLPTIEAYKKAHPILEMIDILKELESKGHTIMIYTARGMGTFRGNQGAATASIGKITLDWLLKNNIPYHEIHFGKPSADFYIDDKALNAKDIHEVRRKTVENIA